MFMQTVITPHSIYSLKNNQTKFYFTMTQSNAIFPTLDLENQYNITSWFAHDQWFLASKSASIIDGIDSWFEKPNEIIKAIGKAIEQSKKMDYSQVEMAFSDDPEFLSQYYQLRDARYKAEWNFKNYNGLETDFDKKSKILIVKYKGNFIGGGRLTLASDVDQLYNEDKKFGYSYKKICAQADIGAFLNDDNYAEISGLVIDPKYKQEHHFLEKILKFMADCCRENNVQYMIGVADEEHIENDKIALEKIGIKSVPLEHFVAPPREEYDYIEAFPIIAFV